MICKDHQGSMYDNVKPSQKERNVEIMIMISEVLHTHCYIDSLICIHQMNLATWCKLESDQDIASQYLILITKYNKYLQ